MQLSTSLLLIQYAIRGCGYRQLDHPPTTQTWFPSDYYFFNYLKKKKFDANILERAAVMVHFEHETPDYFYMYIHITINLVIKPCV